MSTQTQNSEAQTNDPRQLTMPHVDTSIELGWIITANNLWYFVPAVAALVFGLLAYAIGGSLLVAGLLAVPGTIALSCLIYWEITAPPNMTIADRWQMSLLALRINRTFPWTHEEPRGREIHGVKRFESNGTATMKDGRVTGLVNVQGLNTAKISQREASDIVGQWTTAIDEDLRDFSWSIYATTRESDPEDVIERYEQRALGIGSESHRSLGRTTQATRYLRELLLDVSDWFVGVDAEQWSPSEWDFYIVVSVEPWEVKDSVTLDQPSRIRRLSQRIKASIPTRQSTDATVSEQQNGHASAESEGTVQTESDLYADLDQHNRDAITQEQHSELNDRIERVLDGCAGVEGITAERATTLDHAGALINYWSGEGHEQGDEVLSAIDTSDNRVRPGETPAEKMIAPTTYDAADGRVEIGDQLCKTFRVVEWPAQPSPFFLGELFSIRGARVDVRIHVSNEHKPTVIDDLENIMADVGAERTERLEDTDVTAQQVQTDEQAIKKMHHMLMNSTSQSWDVSAYITVRVGPDEAYEAAAQTGRNIASLELAKIYALEQACDTVTEVLEKAPARCGLRTAGQNAHQAFVSSSPTGSDYYNASAATSQRTRMLGGAVGAMFPWCTGTIHEEGGMRFGRNKQNGTPVLADIFNREAGAHALTLGQTRSGKTYATETVLSEWFAVDPDRTLIVCDTEGGFAGLTQLCGGKHIVVDSSSTINPHDIQPPSSTQQAAGNNVNNYQMKIDEVANFYCGILTAQGIDPGPYRSTIEDAAKETYRRAGITRDSATHSKDSPTPSDFIDVLEAQIKDASAYTFTDSEKEVRRKEDVIADLLDKLSGLKPDGKYGHILGETDAGILDPETSMIYVDLSAFSEASEAEKSVMLHLILGQIYQKVKKAAGESVFLIDEAHFLLHSDEMIEYLQDAARAWARYDAALWFVTQSPREFLERATSVTAGQENQRRTILEQCSTVSVFRTPKIDPELLAELGMNGNQIQFIREKARIGNAGRGYSECLINLQDRHGWWETHVEASPLQDYIWSYDPDTHGDFDAYIDRYLGQPHADRSDETRETDETGDPATNRTASGNGVPPETDRWDTADQHDESDGSPAPSVDLHRNN